jgi:hypothetical protein
LDRVTIAVANRAAVSGGIPPVSDSAAPNRPATFREVLAHREYLAVFTSSILSLIGDNMARAAVTALVFGKTGSVAYSAVAFAISYLPWIGIGPMLAAVAERYPYRRVMVICDLARMVLMALIAWPGLNIPTTIGLLFLTALLDPPFDSSRSALLAQVLPGDLYIVGITLQNAVIQSALILGYVSGSLLGSVNPQLALLINAVTFGVSALAIGLGTRARPAALESHKRTSVIRETGEGFALVFRTPVLRIIAVVTFLTGFFSILPEGLAAAWASDLAGSGHLRGLYQAVIMISNPIGFVFGGIAVGRFAKPSTRIWLIRPFAILVPLMLAPALFHPSIVPVAALNLLLGFFTAGLMPAMNDLFVQALPNAFRARAFGVMQSGIQLIQGAALVIGGSLADRFSLPTIIGVWGLAGTVVLAATVQAWPNKETFDSAIQSATALNQEAAAATKT